MILPAEIDDRLISYIISGKHEFSTNAIKTKYKSYRYLESEDLLTMFIGFSSGHIYHFEIMLDDGEIVYQKSHLFSPEESSVFSQLVQALTF